MYMMRTIQQPNLRTALRLPLRTSLRLVLVQQDVRYESSPAPSRTCLSYHRCHEFTRRACFGLQAREVTVIRKNWGQHNLTFFEYSSETPNLA